MSLGERLRQERERLGMSQPKFAALAATTKQTLFSWETGRTAPDGFQLGAMADAGADVLYILTGQRSIKPQPPLKPDEQVLLDGYRALDSMTKRRALAFMLAGSQADAASIVVGKRSRSTIVNGNNNSVGNK